MWLFRSKSVCCSLCFPSLPVLRAERRQLTHFRSPEKHAAKQLTTPSFFPPSLPQDEELGPLPIVFVGDLNGSPKGQVAEYLRHKGFVSAFEAYNRPRAPHKVPLSLPLSLSSSLPPCLPPSTPHSLPAAPQYEVIRRHPVCKPDLERISNQTELLPPSLSPPPD